MRDLNDLYYFVRVVDHGGFAAAARATNMQKSKISRRIQQLEDRLGVRLVNRSTRQFSVTDIGHDYYERCVAMLSEAEAADQVVAEIRAEPRGLIRVSCPVALMHYGFGPLFARFLAKHAGVKITLESTNRHVDVIAEGFDVAIRARFPPLEATDLMMRKLNSIALCLVATPELLERRSINSPADLSVLPSIALGPSQRDHHWRLERADGQTANVSFWPRFISDDLAALRDAALAGVGVVQLPTPVVQQQIHSGELVHVLPDWKPQTVIVHAIFPSRRGVMPSVRILLDFLAAEAAATRRENEEP
jgi:DNA-binding transcriptional LysR family regulator